MQEDVVSRFVKVFQLTPDEIVALRGSSKDAPVTAQFFDALNKTQTIRSNTKYLLQVGKFLGD